MTAPQGGICDGSHVTIQVLSGCPPPGGVQVRSVIFNGCLQFPQQSGGVHGAIVSLLHSLGDAHGFGSATPGSLQEALQSREVVVAGTHGLLHVGEELQPMVPGSTPPVQAICNKPATFVLNAASICRESVRPAVPSHV